jgi:hypothetical protein
VTAFFYAISIPSFQLISSFAHMSTYRMRMSQKKTRPQRRQNRGRGCVGRVRHSGRDVDEANAACMDQGEPGAIEKSILHLVGYMQDSMRRGHQTELECGSEFCRFRARGT